MIVTTCAVNVFRNADEEDRAELADKGTARKFYSAGNFFEVLSQVPPCPVRSVGRVLAIPSLPHTAGRPSISSESWTRRLQVINCTRSGKRPRSSRQSKRAAPSYREDLVT